MSSVGPLQPDDSDVLEAIAQRDYRRALTLLMERHGNAVYRFAYQLTRDATLAEEVRQKAFVDAFRDLPKFQGRSTLKSWLFGITRHRCQDATKTRKRWWQRYKNEAPAEAEIEVVPSADRELERA